MLSAQMPVRTHTCRSRRSRSVFVLKHFLLLFLSFFLLLPPHLDPIWTPIQTLDSLQGQYSTGGRVTMQLSNAYDDIWRRRCKCFMCCIYQQGNKEIWDDVSHVFGSLFDYMDIVPSDVVTGLVLVRAREKWRHQKAEENRANLPSCLGLWRGKAGGIAPD